MGCCASSSTDADTAWLRGGASTGCGEEWPRATARSPKAELAALGVSAEGRFERDCSTARCVSALERRLQRAVSISDSVEWREHNACHAGLALAVECVALATVDRPQHVPAAESGGADAAALARAVVGASIAAAQASAARALEWSDRTWAAVRSRPHARVMLWCNEPERAVAARALRSALAQRLPALVTKLDALSLCALAVAGIWSDACFLRVAPVGLVAALLRGVLAAPEGALLLVRATLALFVVIAPDLVRCASADDLRRAAAALRLAPGSLDAARFDAAWSEDRGVDTCVASWNETWERSALECAMQPARYARRPAVSACAASEAPAMAPAPARPVTPPLWLGFDLDHTLAQYRPAACTRMLLIAAVRIMLRRGELRAPASASAGGAGADTFAPDDSEAVERAARAVVETLPRALRTPPQGLMLRGTVCDTRCGHVLWLDGASRVTRGWRGARELRSPELAAAYGGAPLDLAVLSESGGGSDGKKAGSKAKRFAVAHVQTSLPLIALFALCVAQRDAAQSASEGTSTTGAASARSGRDIFNVVSATFRRLFSSKTATEDNAEAIMRADLGRYIDRTPTVAAWLRELRADRARDELSGVRTFLVTNADMEHASALAAHCLGPAWRSLFDVIVFESAKPKFFSRGAGAPKFRKSARADVRAARGAPEPQLELGGVYRCGNAEALEAFFAATDGAAARDVWYVGDHMEQDVVGAHNFGWHSIAVAPELTALAARLEPRCRIPRTDAAGFGVADTLAYLCGAVRSSLNRGSTDETSAVASAPPAAGDATYAFPSESAASCAAAAGGAAAAAVEEEEDAQPRSPLSRAATRLMTHASLCVPSVQYLADVHGAAGTVALLYDSARSRGPY